MARTLLVGRAASAGTTRAEHSARPVVLLTAGRVMAFAVTFVTPLVMARVFDQAAFGTYKQLVLVSATVAAMAQLGMAESLLYFLPSAPHRGGRYVLNALLVLAVSGLLCLSLFALAGPLLGHWPGIAVLSGLSRLLGVYVLLMLPATVLEIVMTARGHFGRAGLVYGLSDVVRAVAFVIPAAISRRLEWLLIGGVAFGACRLAGTLYYLTCEYRNELRLDRAALREQLAYALPYQLGGALWILVLNLHFFLVASLVDAAAFAIYAVGCLQVPIVDILFSASKNLLTVRMREALTARRPDAALAIWHDSTRRLALVYVFLAGLLLATARELIPFLFTARYAASIPVFMVWSTIALFYAVQADGVLAVYADTRAIAVVYAVQLVLIAGLVPSLMRSFGLAGAVFGNVLAMGIGRSLLLLRATRLMRVALLELMPWRSLGLAAGAATASALVALEVKAHLAAGPLVLLGTTASIFAAMYLGILTLPGLLDANTRLATTARIRLLVGRPANTP